MSTNSSLRPYLDVIVRHSAVIRNIRIDYSSKHLGLSCSGMAGGKLSTIVFSNGYRRGMDTRLLGIRHNGSCYRRSFDWVSGRTGYFGHRVSDKDPFSFYGMFSCCLYLKNGLKNFKNLFESTSLYEQKLNAFLSPSLGLLLSETYRWV